MRKKLLCLLCLLWAAAGLSGCQASADMDADTAAETQESVSEEEDTLSVSDMDLSGEVQLGDYTGLIVTVEALADITQEDVDAYIEELLADETVTAEITNRAVEDGDTVNVDYTAYDTDGNEISGSSVEDYNIKIGSQVFFDGAESMLIGAMPADTVNITVTYPEDYPQEELAGQNAVYKVTINYIVGEEEAELTDAYVASISDCDTVEEFYELIMAMLVSSLESTRESNRQTAVWEAVLENAEVISYGEEDVEELTESYIAYDTSVASDYGMALEEYVESELQMSLEAYYAEIDEIVRELIKEQLVIDAIAEAEGITGTDATEEELETCAANQEYVSVEDYESDRGEEGVAEDIKELRVLDFVVSSAVITEE